MPEAIDTVTTTLSPGAQLAEMLGRPAVATPQRADTAPVKAALVQCPSCKASLSGVEQKFEKCLSCGKSFAGTDSASNVSVGI